MKINILFPINDNPTGGGNQFLRNLKVQFEKMEIYDEIEYSDVVLFNSYQNIDNVIKAKKRYPRKLFVHRVDGPIRLYNNLNDKRDDITNITNKYIADATIFQSEFSRKTNYELGLEKNKYETLIYNATDRNIFFPNEQHIIGEKIKIIASSWSSNVKKGFDVYEYLDKNLDYSKYEMIFVGNSLCEFKNIKVIAPQKSIELANILRQQDIYISASQKDPCSNSVIEAMCCGLPVLCRNDGGHPELVNIGKAGYLFDEAEEVPLLLEQIVSNYSQLEPLTEKFDIRFTAQEYCEFFEYIFNDSADERKYLSLRGKCSIKKALLKYYKPQFVKFLK